MKILLTEMLSCVKLWQPWQMGSDNLWWLFGSGGGDPGGDHLQKVIYRNQHSDTKWQMDSMHKVLVVVVVVVVEDYMLWICGSRGRQMDNRWTVWSMITVWQWRRGSSAKSYVQKSALWLWWRWCWYKMAISFIVLNIQTNGWLKKILTQIFSCVWYLWCSFFSFAILIFLLF